MMTSQPSESSDKDLPQLLDLRRISRLSELGDHCGQNVLDKMSHGFQALARTQLDALRRAIDDDDPRRVGEVAHILRGSAATLGAEQVSRLCGMIEREAKDGITEPLLELIPLLDENITQTLEALDRLGMKISE